MIRKKKHDYRLSWKREKEVREEEKAGKELKKTCEHLWSAAKLLEKRFRPIWNTQIQREKRKKYREMRNEIKNRIHNWIKQCATNLKRPKRNCQNPHNNKRDSQWNETVEIWYNNKYHMTLGSTWKLINQCEYWIINRKYCWVYKQENFLLFLKV